MNRISRWILSLTLLAVLAVCAVAVHAQASYLLPTSGQPSLALVPAPMVFSIGIVIGLALGLGFLSVGIRLSRLYK